MFFRTLLPSLLALAAATIADAGSGIVSGRIVDSGSGFPLPGAHIMLDGAEPGAVSDQDGRFKFTGAASGDHELTVTYIGYTPAAVPVSVSDRKVATLEIELAPGVIVADEVLIVSERLQGQARALNQQKQNPNITNVVAADQVGRFPDANIGDAIKRIPGIVVANDQGEARFGLIRGTEARLNSIMLNGERVPSAEGEVRAVQLDLVPADMIQTIEVNKALTPDMDADAIGGAVNLVTRAAPGTKRLSGTLGSGYNFLSGQPMGLSSVVAGDRFLDGRLGAIVSASYHNHQLGSDNIEAEWDEEDGTVYMSEFQVRKYDVDRVRSSLSGALDYRLDDRNEFYLSAMFNQRDDYENRYRLTVRDLELPEGGVTPEGQIRRQTKGGSSDIGDARLEDQATASMTVGGEHLLGNAFEVDWSATYARASEERPDERYIQYRVRDVGVRPDIGDPERPGWSAADEAAIALSEFELHEITEENQFTEEEDLNARVDFSFPWLRGESGNRLQFGFRYRGKEKLRDNDFFEYEPIDEDGFASLGTVARRDYSDTGFLAGDYLAGEFVTEEFLGGLALDDPEQFERGDLPEEYVAGNYEARETVTGGYLMVEQTLGPRLDLLLGLRVEDTRIDYTGNELFVDPEADEEITTRPVTGEDGYLHLLPGLHARYRLDDATALRFAWTNTLGRPNYYDLVPYREVLIEDEELFEGNPALDPTTSMNFDLMAERYFSTVGLVSAGLFHKDISDFVFRYADNDYADPVSDRLFGDYVQPLNGSSASVSGFEFAFQRQLDFLPSIWRGIGLYTNYTWTRSSVEGLPVEGREEEDLPLPGSAPHSFNGSLSYDMSALSLRLSVNYAASHLDAGEGEIGESAFYDRYYDTATHVDLNGSYRISPQLRAFFEASNLTDQPLRFYQGVKERTMQAEYYDRRFSAGLKFDLL